MYFNSQILKERFIPLAILFTIINVKIPCQKYFLLTDIFGIIFRHIIYICGLFTTDKHDVLLHFAKKKLLFLVRCKWQYFQLKRLRTKIFHVDFCFSNTRRCSKVEMLLSLRRIAPCCLVKGYPSCYMSVCSLS